ncbi:MAG: hypothetical protein RIS35_2839 [Pseudomonadota bacterium]|jgi:Flp pilus assembly protein TadG
MHSRHRPTRRLKSQTGSAVVELALVAAILAPLVFAAVEVGLLIRADLALRSVVRAGAQAPVVTSPPDWRTSTLTGVVRAAAVANVDATSLPGFSQASVTTSVVCACTEANASAAQCTAYNASGAEEFACPEPDGSFTPPRIYVDVEGSYRFAVSLLPSKDGNGGITLSRAARMRVQ